MPVSEAQKRANEAYRKANVKSFTVKFYPADHDLYEYLQTIESKNEYIRQLIRDDMECTR